VIEHSAEAEPSPIADYLFRRRHADTGDAGPEDSAAAKRARDEERHRKRLAAKRDRAEQREQERLTAMRTDGDMRLARKREREERRHADRRSGRARREAERHAAADAREVRREELRRARNEARAAERQAAEALVKQSREQARLAEREIRRLQRRQMKKIDLRSHPGLGEVVALVHADAAMDYDRLYTLWQAVLSAPPDASIVEVGAYQGRSAKFIAEAFRRRGLAPCFYVCDTFSGHPRVDDAIDLPIHTEGQKFLDTSKESVAEYLEAYGNIRLVVGDIIETAPQLAHESKFGLVHIDVDVYPATDFCVRFFAPRLARGALLIVDDYGYLTCPGAKKAVDDFVAASSEFQMLHLLSGQAVLFRVAP
jgi:hypothetical protein